MIGLLKFLSFMSFAFLLFGDIFFIFELYNGSLKIENVFKNIQEYVNLTKYVDFGERTQQIVIWSLFAISFLIDILLWNLYQFFAKKQR